MNSLEMMIMKIGKKAVKDAQKDGLKQGVANVYSKNKQLFFQLPDGTITQNVPAEYKWSLIRYFFS